MQTIHRQEKGTEAQAAMDDFLDSWDGENSKEVWRYLRTKGHGQYVDRIAPLEPTSKPQSMPESPADPK